MTQLNLTPTIDQLRDRLKEIEAEREYLVLALGALDALEKIAEKADDDAGKVTWLDGEIHANLNDRKDLSEYKQASWSLKPPTFGEMFARVGWTRAMDLISRNRRSGHPGDFGVLTYYDAATGKPISLKEFLASCI